MRINHFSARKVHGYHNIDIDFTNDITFLIGNNGSGKTTALKLLQAAFTLDLSILFSIKFLSITLRVEINNFEHKIVVEKINDHLQFTLDGDTSESTIPLLGDEELKHYSKNARLEEYLEELRFRFLKSANKKLRSFLDEERPLFLGLERRMSNIDDDRYSHEDELFSARVRYPSKARRGMVEGLDNCEYLVEKTYRRYRQVSDLSGKKLINVIVDSTFDYFEFQAETWFEDSAKRFKEVHQLLNRRSEIEKFAQELGGGAKAISKINYFFSKIEKLLEGSKNDITKESFSIELLMNKAQIQRMHSILEEMDRQKRNAERVYSPIKSFVNKMNAFFEYSKKQINVDSVGRLNVTQNGVSIPLSSLSSGEKQLLILMAHSMFARNSGSVFIVDEPELSLHLRWQEMLVDSLVSNEKNNQFIFATHSPEIVGFRKENCFMVS